MSMRYLAGFISAFYNPLKVPDAPTIGTATATSTTSVSVTFTAPANVGGGAITGYVATAKRMSDGVSFSASGASSPITITGLTEVPFTVTVAAVNLFGPSLSSAASNSVTPAIAPGQAYGGGYFAGQISTAGNGIADYNLVIGPVSSAESSSKQWKNANTATTGADSVINGPQNTADMVADGSSTVYPAAHFCNDLVIGGFSDWYMPAENELEICYYNLKPIVENNNTSTGANANAVPARASNYTTSNPAQTSAADFKDTGTEDFAGVNYWVSTETGIKYGGCKNFNTGAFPIQYKTNNLRVRAVRRVAV